jgi:16S rRNA (guanine966-N2)-methyltransferase
VTFVDRDPRALALVDANLAACGVRDGYAIIRKDLGRREEPLTADFDLVILDPPYDTNAASVLEAVAPMLAPDGLLVLEYDRRRGAPVESAGLTRVREAVAGDSALGFYRRTTPTPDAR